jgi:hypothetical protein
MSSEVDGSVLALRLLAIVMTCLGFVATFHLRGVPLRFFTDREVEEREHDRF